MIDTMMMLKPGKSVRLIVKAELDDGEVATFMDVPVMAAVDEIEAPFRTMPGVHKNALEGAAIRSLRRLCGFSMADVCPALGCSPAQLSRYEVGELRIPDDVWARAEELLT